jgi:cytochrome c oxidase subunit 2
VLALALSGCAAQPLGYMTGTGGHAADRLREIGWGLSAVSVIVVVLIAGLIGLAIARGRRRLAAEGDGVGRDFGGLSWIYWGVGLSFPVLIALAVWTFIVTRAVANPPSPTALTVEITAHRWWWEIRYRGERAADEIVTANHLVLPVGIPVRLLLTSDDVIHDFWVPKLGPKMDMIPGKSNATWLEADRPGLYRGQCAEYCGLEHARMAFTVTAVPVNDFRRWRREQLQPQVPRVGRGAAVFTSACSACHTVRGTGAAGILGPDLTHFASRPTIAAGVLPNTVSGRLEWLGDTQGVKPGAAMPQVPLDEADRGAVAQYIGSLR